MTKSDAIEKIMKDYNGIVTLQIIYNNIEKYYPNAKKSDTWQAGIRGVLYRDIGKRFRKIDVSTYALIDYDTLNLLPDNCREGVLEKDLLVKVRTQQTLYRKRLLARLKYCPISGVTDKRLLVASHIKPWCLSSSEEKMDIYNGFILTPLYDKLFDSGLITFTSKKEIVLSSTLTHETITQLGLRNCICEKLPIEGRERYLEFHNSEIFIK